MDNKPSLVAHADWGSSPEKRWLAVACLKKGLSLKMFDELRRLCEMSVPAWSVYPGRRAACPLFWTLGGQQVGKAAILGWREVLSGCQLPGEPQDEKIRKVEGWILGMEYNVLQGGIHTHKL